MLTIEGPTDVEMRVVPALPDISVLQLTPIAQT